MFIFPVQLTMSRIGNLTRLIHTLLYVMTIHTYIQHTYSLLYSFCIIPHVCSTSIMSRSNSTTGMSARLELQYSAASVPSLFSRFHVKRKVGYCKTELVFAPVFAEDMALVRRHITE